MSNTSKYPNLEYLIGAYFHQDWGLDFRSDRDLVVFFANENPKERVEGCVTEIRELIASDLSNTDIADLSEHHYEGNVPYDTPNEVRSWLGQVSANLMRSIHFS